LKKNNIQRLTNVEKDTNKQNAEGKDILEYK